MSHGDHNRVPAELREVEYRLRDDRPELTTLELDAIKRRAMTSAARKSPSSFTLQKGILMKSRLAVAMVLALGLVMSGTGATLAVSGLSDSGSAGTAQYPDVDADRQPDDVLGTQEDDTTPTSDAVSPTQATRQVESSDESSLPFTGFLAIPILIGGVGLLGTGIAMRRRVSSNDEDGAGEA